MPRGCFGTCGCLAGTARAVVDSPVLSCCCKKKNRTQQRRFLEYFSRFHQVNHLVGGGSDTGPTTTSTATATNENNMRAVPMSRGGSNDSCHVQCYKRPNLRLLVCTANLGNEQPDVESIAHWIPPDGFFVQDPVLEEVDELNIQNNQEENDDDDEAEDPSDRCFVSHETKYPLRYHHHHDENADEEPHDIDALHNNSSANYDECLMLDSLSKQLDLVVIGLQEATFDPPKSESMSEGSSIRIRVPRVKAIQKLQTLRAAKDFSTAERSTDSDRTSTLSTNGTTSESSGMVTTALQTILRDEWEDGTHALHSLFEGRLPSYTRLVSYQRGQMRLIVFGRTRTADANHDPVLPLQVLHTAAQNTGRAGLANKGGIVTEILANGCTRLSFVSCHLEAHEGASKYAIRCQTLADILRGTAPRKKVHNTVGNQYHRHELAHKDSAHLVSPSLHSSHPSSSHMAIDVSLTAHYSFVLGDLNFRTDLSYMDPSLAEKETVHKKSVFNMVEAADWDGLNNADELHRALRNKHCLVGFQTLQCNFPPTFKVERQAGYQYIDKRRPSYTDRILFKTGHQLDHGLKPLLYEPIDDFTTSDHKPVRAAFNLQLNSPFRVRPRAVRNPSMRWNRANRSIAQQNEPVRKRTFMPRLLQRSVGDEDGASVSSNTSVVVDLSSGQGHGRTGDSLQLFVNNITVILNQDDNHSSHGTSGPNPYLILMTQPEEAIRLPIIRRGKGVKRMLKRLGLGKRSTTERTKHGWPCTSIKSNTHFANWEEEEIACQVATHTPQGGSLDLSGAVLFLNVMSCSTEDTLLGTVCFNLVNLIKTSARNRSGTPGERSADDICSSQPLSQRRRVGRKSIISSIFRSRVARQTNEGTSGSGVFGFGRSNPSVDDDLEDPIASVQINEPLLKDGVEVGTLSCTIESWWMDEAAALIARKPAEGNKATQQESQGGFFRRTKQKQRQPDTPTRAEKRGAFVNRPSLVN